MIHGFPYTDLHDLNLDWIISKIKALGFDTEKLEEDLKDLSENLQDQIDYLTDWVNNYTDAWAKSVIEKYLASMIFVEITDAGYIVYFIPDSWDEITFNTTDLDITIPDVDYGHLVLSY